MSIDLLKPKYFDFILIQNKSIVYFRISKKKNNFKILKNEKIVVDLYNQGNLNFSNFDSALNSLIKKYKLKELGIILNLPNIVFLKIDLIRTPNLQETILNYLKINFPLSIDEYTLYYKEEVYRSAGSPSTFSVFLINKDLINQLLLLIQKNDLIPLFITPQIEIIYQYLVNKALIEFNEEYLIFFLAENNIVTLNIENFKIKRIIIEECDLNINKIETIILKIYNFLKSEIKENAKIFFFLENNNLEIPEIKQPKIFFDLSPNNVILESSYLISNFIFENKSIIDFLPFKNYYAYFINRLPKVITFLIIYLLFLISFTSGLFLTFKQILTKEKFKINQHQKIVQIPVQTEESIKNLLRIKNEFDSEIFEKISYVKPLITINEVNEISYQNKNLTFDIKVDKNNLEKIKSLINQNFPQAKIIEESTINNEVNLKYSIQK